MLCLAGLLALPCGIPAEAELPGDPPPVADESRIDETRMDFIENFRVPVEKHENGQVKTMLHAKRAAMRGVGVIEAEQVRIEMYGADGTLETVITAESATVDQRRGRGTGRGPVRLERKDVTISGVGLTWISSENSVRIESEAMVELDREGRTLVEGWR